MALRGLKLLYIVLDGAPDGPSPRRALDEARKPNLDALAGNALCYRVYTIGRGVAPESDSAVISLLGYDPNKYYTGRGPLEALGAGIEFREGQVAFRANFATIDPKTRRILDRRVGRSLTSSEARELAKALDGMTLAGGEARAIFKATVGHRAVLVLEHSRSRLSAAVSNSDPAYARMGYISVALKDYEPYIAKIEPLEDTPEARLTAELANEFSERAIKILEEHPVNVARVERGLLPANAVLLRDAGDRLPPVRPFTEVHGFKMASIVEMPVERGVARALGIDDFPVDVEGRSRGELLEEEARLALDLIYNKGYDGVYVHLKGPDEPGHDGDLEGKIKAIEEIDKHFFGLVTPRIERRNTIVVVTSDHATPWSMRAHSSDPVPLMVSHPSLPEGPRRFTETECLKQAIDTIEGAYNIIPLIRSIASKLAGLER
ncbi:MAG: alkaline phosphatase family protein [Desulfurococcales archaeon]|nr:alkaline phosphatase family protein [Desulfurococcales archaeon]